MKWEGQVEIFRQSLPKTNDGVEGWSNELFYSLSENGIKFLYKDNVK